SERMSLCISPILSSHSALRSTQVAWPCFPPQWRRRRRRHRGADASHLPRRRTSLRVRSIILHGGGRAATLHLRARALVLGRRDQPVRLSSPGGGSRAQPPARGVHGRTGSSKAATCARHLEPGSTTSAEGCLLLVCLVCLRTADWAAGTYTRASRVRGALATRV